MMNPTSQNQTGTTTLTRPPSLKRSHSDMRGSRHKWIDDEYYRAYVLRLPAATNEDEIDQNLKAEAEGLGMKQLQLATNVESITSSLSATTIASDPTNQGSIMSQSTAPTSCSSSEHRPVTTSSKLDLMPAPVVTPSILSDIEKKRRNSGFRKGIRKMAGFSRKRKSLNLQSPSALSSIGSGSLSDLDSIKTPKDIDVESIRSSIYTSPLLKSPSLKSNKSSGLWSDRLSTTEKSSYERDAHEILLDHEALRRSMECKEIINLRAKQFEEKQRVLTYQQELLSSIEVRRTMTRAQKEEVQKRVLAEQVDKNDKAVEEMESRQLEDELKVLKEHEADKLKILARLRHMEAYCQTLSPPSTPMDATFPLSHSGSDRTSSSASLNRGSIDSVTGIYLPERKITDRDYHNLAASYHERDAMNNLHASRINVLRGRQKRAVENFVLKKEREIEKIEQEQRRELDIADLEFTKQEASCRRELREKKRTLERRWKIEAIITKLRQERLTGLKHDVLPDVIFTDDEPSLAMLALT